MTRRQVSQQEIDMAIEVLRSRLERKLLKHGYGAYASPHEVLGIIVEEHKELVDAVHANDRDNTIEELLDIAVGCVFGVASL